MSNGYGPVESYDDSQNMYSGNDYEDDDYVNGEYDEDEHTNQADRDETLINTGNDMPAISSDCLGGKRSDGRYQLIWTARLDGTPVGLNTDPRSATVTISPEAVASALRQTSAPWSLEQEDAVNPSRMVIEEVHLIERGNEFPFTVDVHAPFIKSEHVAGKSASALSITVNTPVNHVPMELSSKQQSITQAVKSQYRDAVAVGEALRIEDRRQYSSFMVGSPATNLLVTVAEKNWGKDGEGVVAAIEEASRAEREEPVIEISTTRAKDLNIIASDIIKSVEASTVDMTKLSVTFQRHGTNWSDPNKLIGINEGEYARIKSAEKQNVLTTRGHVSVGFRIICSPL